MGLRCRVCRTGGNRNLGKSSSCKLFFAFFLFLSASCSDFTWVFLLSIRSMLGSVGVCFYSSSSVSSSCFLILELSAREQDGLVRFGFVCRRGCCVSSFFFSAGAHQYFFFWGCGCGFKQNTARCSIIFFFVSAGRKADRQRAVISLGQRTVDHSFCLGALYLCTTDAFCNRQKNAPTCFSG